MRPTFTQESDFRRERDFGQKVSATFEFMGTHFRPLGRVLLYLVMPGLLLQSILAAVFNMEMMGAMRVTTPGLGGVLGAQSNVLTNLLSGPTYWLSMLVTTSVATILILSIYGYIKQCLVPRPAGESVTVPEVWEIVRSEFLGAFFSLWGLTIIISFASILLLIPGIYLAVALSIFFAVKVVEGTGFMETVRRCLHLTKGKWWSTFGVIFIMIAMLYLVMIGVGISVTVFSGGLRMLFQTSVMTSPLFAIVISSISSLSIILLYPPILLALAFQYFNLVERKEGIGLRRMVDALGKAPATQVSNATYRPDDEGEY